MKPLVLILILCLVATARPTSLPQESAKISEISLEMVQGSIELGKPLGRAFKIILRANGTAVFEGKANVKLIGKYEGKISEEAFGQLASFLAARNYSQIGDEWPDRMTAAAGVETYTAYDSPVVTTNVVRNGNRKTIRRLTIVSSNYKRKVPREITEIENAITEAAMRISWKKVDK